MLFNTKWENNLTYPSIGGFVHVLRNKDLWPKDFQWRKNGQSSLNLACMFWPASVGEKERSGDISTMLAMNLNMKDHSDKDDTGFWAYHRMFFARRADHHVPTADDIADRLEAFMNRETNAKAFASVMALRLGC